jgi:hypothetical protein
MHGFITQVGLDKGVPVLDPFPALVATADHGTPGFDLFTDAFHPMPATNRIIALTVLDEVRTLGLGGPQRQVSDAAVAASENRVQAILRRSPAPKGNQMVRAILAGDYDAAVRIGRSLPENWLLDEGLPESFYLGWALTRSGDMTGAQALFTKLRARRWKPWFVAPVLDTDEDMVRNAFGGDSFAWF